MSDFDTREWRAETHEVRGGLPHACLHLSAVNRDGSRDVLLVAPHRDEAGRACLAQIVREHTMLSAPYADEQHQGGHWLDVLPQRPRWHSTNPDQGRCGKTFPHLSGAAETYCCLPSGHGGWHRDDNGQEAGVGW